MAFFRKKENDLELAVSIKNPVSSEIFQDILKENNIPFVCRQNGADGSVKLLLGAGWTADNIYVRKENIEKAKELYTAYFNNELENQFQIEEEE